ncbi:LLM class F420-dependent oxidoreductase [Frankia sp. AiPs1]|uniref:LLM class F420-dependent oxidoreductase n=1 Tax=Frankia sp. AiPs1 TaxID=573493 RepID=UPI002043829A|nr:LLM class F420-dependent oxidoreductase [Frankia sp. AiPs1]MCM3925691.1 LLM class F420-dependent oxidoreductase [Frankia sp. AiPs1]
MDEENALRFVYQYPETNGTEGDLLDSGDVGELATAAEAAGFHGFAFTEHPVPGARWLASGGHQSLDPFVALSAAAAVTTRLRLLTYLAVVPYRNPFLLAKSAATLDKISHGRLTLGVGTGYQKAEFFALGVDFDERNELFDEALEVLPLHWKGEPFSYQGKHFSARDVIARPRPVQDPIPIWIGGNSKLTLRRVAQKTQGWMPLGGPAELFTTTRTAQLATTEAMAAKIRELRELAGERGAQLDIAPAYLDATINRPDHEADRHREAFQTLADAGVTNLIISAPGGSPKESLEFIEAFGATYL